MSLNDPEELLPEAVLLVTWAQLPGLPLLSGARHNSARFKPEPPVSDTV